MLYLIDLLEMNNDVYTVNNNNTNLAINDDNFICAQIISNNINIKICVFFILI